MENRDIFKAQLSTPGCRWYIANVQRIRTLYDILRDAYSFIRGGLYAAQILAWRDQLFASHVKYMLEDSDLCAELCWLRDDLAATIGTDQQRTLRELQELAAACLEHIASALSARGDYQKREAVEALTHYLDKLARQISQHARQVEHLLIATIA